MEKLASSTSNRSFCFKRRRCLEPKDYFAFGSATSLPTREKGGSGEPMGRQTEETRRCVIRPRPGRSGAAAGPRPPLPCTSDGCWAAGTGDLGPASGSCISSRSLQRRPLVL